MYSVHCFSYQALKVRSWNWACCCVVPWKRRESNTNRCEYRLQIITCFFDLWSKMFTCWQAGTGQRLELGRFQPREEWEREHKLLRVYYYVNEVKIPDFQKNLCNRWRSIGPSPVRSSFLKSAIDLFVWRICWFGSLLCRSLVICFWSWYLVLWSRQGVVTTWSLSLLVGH